MTNTIDTTTQKEFNSLATKGGQNPEAPVIIYPSFLPLRKAINSAFDVIGVPDRYRLDVAGKDCTEARKFYKEMEAAYLLGKEIEERWAINTCGSYGAPMLHEAPFARLKEAVNSVLDFLKISEEKRFYTGRVQVKTKKLDQ